MKVSLVIIVNSQRLLLGDGRGAFILLVIGKLSELKFTMG